MYNSYFGFLESPFSVTPDPRFFYTNPIYQEAYAIPRYGIEAKKGFIVVTGEVGTGKTTLLRKLMRNLEDTVHNLNWVFAGQDLAPSPNEGDIATQATRRFVPPYRGIIA
jgi:type II secretory pathway predicted ATPase ExeA